MTAGHVVGFLVGVAVMFVVGWGAVIVAWWRRRA